MYEAVIDFRLMSSEDLAQVRAGFRSVIRRAYYTPDAELDRFLFAKLRVLLQIEEATENRAGLPFAAGRAMAFKTRGVEP